MDLMKQKQWFDSPEFQQEFHCELPLGAFPSCEGTLFRLWSPTAQAVTLRLYSDGTTAAPFETHSLQKAERGLWVYETKQDLNGTYYDYLVTVDGIPRKTADPYAVACGLNGHRSMVLDLKTTDPEGWSEDKAPAHTPDQVIYELHVKDFSWDPAGGFDPADRGHYSALCRTGTTLNNDGIHSTGLDYLKQLGVTHIQFMPIYDFGSVDEAGPEDRYNWGYDPVNYNIPEGSYSSDPCHGEVRIRELKEAIQALHENGFRVIMDVVYNHTYSLDSWLWRVAPWYYYRQLADGSPADGSGCGDDLASERSMCTKYIIDSILHWTEEYHMDGFRFDLMGLLDADLMNAIQTALDERYGKGEKLIYGEPWSATSTAARPGTVLCSKDNLKALQPSIGAFCDATRDAVKGGLMDINEPGFVNGGGITAKKLRKCLTGWAADETDIYQAPSQTITYLSCHDDWTLWDKLVYTMDPQKDFETLQPAILKANRLAAAINLCCQGRLFFLSGEEFGRTKQGVKNSFRSSPEINKLDWSRAWKAQELVDYYRGLIVLRMELPGLQDKSANASKRVLSVIETAPNCVMATVDNAGEGSKWQELLLIFSAASETQTISLPKGDWQVLADGISSFRWQEDLTLSGTASVPPVSALLLGKHVK